MSQNINVSEIKSINDNTVDKKKDNMLNKPGLRYILH